MIVIIGNASREMTMNPGDFVELIHTEKTGSNRWIDHVIIRHEVVKTTHLDYAVTFCFADEDGNCVSSNIAGFFGQKDNLPDEMKNAMKLSDLNLGQLNNFAMTCPVKIEIFKN